MQTSKFSRGWSPLQHVCRRGELDLSPAVVSKRISHLEGRLGTRLFHRTTRQLQLTETGRGFYERVVQILATVQEAEAFVSSGHERAAGTLRITAPTAFSRLHIAPYLGGFMEQHPDLSLEIIATDHIMDIVREGIDVAIRIAELDDFSLVAKKLAPCRRLFLRLARLFEGKRHAQDARRSLLAQSAGGKQRGLAHPRPGRPRFAETLQRPQDQQQRNRSRSGDRGMRGWLPRDLANPRRPAGPATYPDPAAISRGTWHRDYAVYPDKQYVPARLRVFVDFLAQTYGPSPYWEEGLELPKPQNKKTAAHEAIVTADV